MLVILISIGLLASFLPDHRPLTEEEIARALLDGSTKDMGSLVWRLKPNFYYLGYLVALLLLAGGLKELVGGIVHREHEETFCFTCGTTVVARRIRGGLRCPTGKHNADIRPPDMRRRP